MEGGLMEGGMMGGGLMEGGVMSHCLARMQNAKFSHFSRYFTLQ